MPATTKTIETLSSASLNQSVDEVLKGGAPQAKPKSAATGKKPSRSAQAPQTPQTQTAGAIDKARGDASNANMNAIRKAAAKVTTASANKVSEPAKAGPHAALVQVEKGLVEVSDKKPKKIVEAMTPVPMVQAPVVHAPVVQSPVVQAPLAHAAVAQAPVVPSPSVQAPSEAAQPVATPAPHAKVEDKSKVAKTGAPRQGFKTLEYIVYPAHGVGQITAIEEQEVAGYKLELFVISFIKDKMILKVPVPKVTSVGMRKLAEAPVVKRALDTLTGRARVKRTMWSRRAQEYEAKINSGDLVSIAEVVRDLYRSDAQPEQSYSERQLYEAALDRIAREIAAVQKLTDQEALKVIEEQLLKSPRRVKVEETDAEDAEETDVVEAA